ncbi:MAG: RDD family protein [Methanomicrobia archaeon]|nr:RDD family protein [Methanomicrobia archaeon]
MLEELDVDTGKLNFHLKKLGDLIEKDEKGLYKLTDKGLRAFSIIQQVPEKIEEASAARRIAAYFLDFFAVILVSLIYFIFPIKISGIIQQEFVITPFYILTILLVFWIYLTIFENEGGQTLGKALLDIKAVGEMNIKKAAVRNFPKAFIIPLIIDVILGRKYKTLRFIDKYAEIRVVKL